MARAGTRIEFTNEMKSKVAELRESSGWGAVSLSKRIKRDKLPGHDHATVGRILGIVNAQAAKTVSKELFESVVYALENLDHNEAGLVGYEKCPGRVVLEDDFLAKLEALMDNYHHLSTAKALRLLGAPADLSPHIVSRLRIRKQTTLKSSHYAFFERCFKS